MSLTVTLHVYSGRPNPQWILPDAAAEEFNERLQKIASVSRVSNLKPAAMGGLGYRGFNVRETGQSRGMRLHSGMVDQGQGSPTLLTADRTLERWLLNTAGRNITDSLRDYIAKMVSTPALDGPIILVPPRLLCPLCMAKDAPVRDATFWGTNDGIPIVNRNNTYNYANDRVTNTNANPGKGSGNIYTQTDTCTGAGSVQEAAIADGLVACANFSDPLAAGQGWYVALALWPGHDYHFYRQDRSGCWSHKAYQEVVQVVDNANLSIRDPKTADRGPYTLFCTYMITKCCVRIR
jgi:hypothetical protein